MFIVVYWHVPVAVCTRTTALISHDSHDFVSPPPMPSCAWWWVTIVMELILLSNKLILISKLSIAFELRIQLSFVDAANVFINRVVVDR